MEIEIKQLSQEPNTEIRLDSVIASICHGMWSVNPYFKCDLRCHYCCTLAQGDSLPPDEPIDSILQQILSLPEQDTVIFGAYSDAYPNAEAKYRITRKLLGALADSGRRAYIVTKGIDVLADIDVLKRFEDRVLVQISISTLDDATSLRIEPGAHSSSARLEAVHTLHNAGIPVEVNALPWIPGVSDLEALLAAIPAGIQVTVSPLATRIDKDTRRLCGQTFSRDEIITAYLAERERLQDRRQLSWVRPAKEGHHHPMYRFDDYVPGASAIDFECAGPVSVIR
jgi:DNA repair photolyase